MDDHKENWYKPGEVRVSKMTEAEMDADKKQQEQNKKRYAWRQDKKAMCDILSHEIGSVQHVKTKQHK